MPGMMTPRGTVACERLPILKDDVPFSDGGGESVRCKIRLPTAVVATRENLTEHGCAGDSARVDQRRRYSPSRIAGFHIYGRCRTKRGAALRGWTRGLQFSRIDSPFEPRLTIALRYSPMHPNQLLMSLFNVLEHFDQVTGRGRSGLRMEGVDLLLTVDGLDL